MTNVSITLPADYSVESRGVFTTVELGKLSADIIGRLALHGLGQKIGDSAASAMADAGFKGMKFADLDEAQQASVRALAKAAMDATLEALVKGEWTERKAGESVDPVAMRVRSLVGTWLRANAKEVWAKNFKDLEAADRGKAIDVFFAGQDDNTRAAFEAEASAQLKAEAKAKAKAAGLTIKLAV